MNCLTFSERQKAQFSAGKVALAGGLSGDTLFAEAAKKIAAERAISYSAAAKLVPTLHPEISAAYGQSCYSKFPLSVLPKN